VCWGGEKHSNSNFINTVNELSNLFVFNQRCSQVIFWKSKSSLKSLRGKLKSSLKSFATSPSQVSSLKSQIVRHCLITYVRICICLKKKRILSSLLDKARFKIFLSLCSLTVIDGGKIDIYGYLLLLSCNQIALNRF